MGEVDGEGIRPAHADDADPHLFFDSDHLREPDGGGDGPKFHANHAEWGMPRCSDG